ncbi:hypothetical protein FIBSPDRAFT_1041874 [Athelia psychrophila]|uniref:Uncharacterized protein n=1 Tax=Athelia psychrophila TaxID=1759441 RepID=A0A166N849_9AGAM|nr:hypothetical protein FIBSPDRAFT_929632 [Fibularhizoctonia sp. CBS 109695]KZP24748.1 hypothetical protein FIBSPDRAFT_1041874 [Fibularhizoctonia sp. CBS 109695]
MESPTFLKWRIIAFCWTSLASMLFIIMLTVIMYGRWQFFDRDEKSCVVILLLVNTINVVALPVLIIRQFRVWLEAARMFFLLMINIGVASTFAFYTMRFQCPVNTPDSQGNCQLLNVCILMASWITPALLITYSACLSFWVWWLLRHPVEESTAPEMASKFDEEAATGQPIRVVAAHTRMKSRRPPLTISIPPSPPSDAVLSRTPFPENGTAGRDRKKSFGGESTSVRSARPPMSARLSKQRPMTNHY